MRNRNAALNVEADDTYGHPEQSESIPVIRKLHRTRGTQKMDQPVGWSFFVSLSSHFQVSGFQTPLAT